MNEAAGKKDFFISYTKRDRAWALWIEWIVRESGFTTVIQERDFNENRDFLHDVQQGILNCRRILAVFSPRYFKSKWCMGELQSFYYKDPDGKLGLIVPVQIETSGDTGLYASRPVANLVALSREEARLEIRQLVGVEKHDFSQEPDFPGEPGPEPAFPPAGERSRRSKPSRWPWVSLLVLACGLMVVYLVALFTVNGILIEESVERFREAQNLNETTWTIRNLSFFYSHDNVLLSAFRRGQKGHILGSSERHYPEALKELTSKYRPKAKALWAEGSKAAPFVEGASRVYIAVENQWPEKGVIKVTFWTTQDTALSSIECPPPSNPLPEILGSLSENFRKNYNKFPPEFYRSGQIATIVRLYAGWASVICALAAIGLWRYRSRHVPAGKE